MNDNKMDALSKSKEAQKMTSYGNSFGCVQASVTVFKISSNESFNNLPAPMHELVNANSFDFNAPASLSDDSGIPLTTNSSVSSGDSYRLGLCKFEDELEESDGEASQFDSLDNCSEGGMSAENFNTLKKGPLAPIDPPPEFQDSPENTIKQYYPKNSLRRWTSSQSSFEHLRERVSHETSILKNTLLSDETIQHSTLREQENFLKESYNANKHLYSSDSILNTHTDNIYDEPNNILSSSLGNSIDAIDDSDVSTACPPSSVSLAKLKPVCPHFEDHTRYFKAIPSAQDNLTKVGQKFDVHGLPDENNYGLYFRSHRGTFQQNENNIQRKYLPSPLCHSFYCHHYQSSAIGCNNRPNSRNSLNSRLSSSHNSLSVSSTNKPDDSIFITQAMSHDALLSREISDFYNVPIDSDIYAFPVDMIKTENSSSKKTNGRNIECFINSDNTLLKSDFESRQSKLGSRHKRKKKSAFELNIETAEGTQITNNQNGSSDKNDLSLACSNSCCLSDEHSQEPFHMTLDEVKQFYQTLYTDKTFFRDRLKKNLNLSNETIWNLTKAKEKPDSYTIKTSKTMPKFNSKAATANSNGNNNNNVIESLTNGGISKIKSQTGYFVSNGPEDVDCGGPKVPGNSFSVNNSVIISESKSNINGEKRSQFTLNLKQKFCSIFRFRRNQNRCRRTICANPNNEAKDTRNFANVRTADEKRKKFQSRALPPLPKKSDQSCNNCNTEEKKVLETKRPFQFTSSIEKVKDYGWYWGPLSSEAAEKVLSNEPDGSFIVRDSSDDHYIFSLSFKLNNSVRHVRIEQDQGTFSFGSYAKFKSQTITEFIEKAVDHSRSGRYLFFLHRRPEHGPMRVQLTNPVSRFKHVQSLQHMCRFVILKAVIRKDLIQSLPLPRRLLDYLQYKQFYSEQVESDCSHSQISDEGPF